MAARLHRQARAVGIGSLLAAACFTAIVSATSATEQSRVYHHGSRAEQVVALTFDDGWTPSNCARVDRILQSKGAAATFFPSARWVERAPSLWKALATRYPFGDHTSSHPHMKSLSYAQQRDEIASDRATVERITGVPLIPVFRAPYGEFDSTTLEAAAAAGFPVTMEWDVNVYDVTSRSDAELLAEAVAGRNGSVITMHCGAEGTVRILPKVIDDYRSRGFRFVTVPELLSDQLPVIQSPLPTVASSPQSSPGVAAAGASGPAGPRTSSRIGPDLLRSRHLLAVLALAGAVLLWSVLVGAGAAPGGPSRGLRGRPNG